MQTITVKLEIDNNSRHSIFISGEQEPESSFRHMITIEQIKELTQLLHNIAYAPNHDIYYLPSEIIKLGTQLGIK